MSSQVPCTPRAPELPVSPNPMRAGAPSASTPFGGDDLRQMLFRSECFAEDLIESCPVH